MKGKFMPLVCVFLFLFLMSCENSITPSQEKDSLERSAAVLSGSTSSLDPGKPVGWATENGGTSGGSGLTIVVDSSSELQSALDSDSVGVIYIKGTIKLDSRLTMQDTDDKTIIGYSGSKLVSDDLTKKGSGILYVKRSTNIIFRNITFEGPGAYDTDGYDNLCLDDCQNIWVDHCTFEDGVDGNFDIKNKSNYISVTWCTFSYEKSPISGGSGGSDDHRYSNLIGSSDSATGDEGKLKVTFQYCRWGKGCRERMPRVRYGQVHVANCLYDSSVSNHCIRAAYKANLLIEGNYFDDQKEPVDLYNDYTAVYATNNYGASSISKGSVFDPPYSMSIASYKNIVSPIKDYAGATLSY